ncbi:unnamed protein product [Adineta steineri]|uniref:NAD(P)(+)--arginine ADP-ribosyltransferase n=1 Tax=Adineta steineri TaxID=433720 RepID=A0A819Z9M5_9BILA|nr:unnamed protein product [Adineta steineri]CAF4170799.1 unnamed protein product [Adineta steineri]
MSSRSRLHTRSRHQNNTRSIKKINLVIFDIDVNQSMLSDPTIEMKIFNKDEIDSWFDYITSDVNEIHLFVSNLLHNTFIQFIHDYPQIKSIYIFCKDQQYRNYSNTLTKLQGTFDDINVVWQKFQRVPDRDMCYNYYDSKQSTFRNMDSTSAETLWWIVFDKILQHIKYTDIAKDEFIEFCRNFVGNSKDKLREIQELVDCYKSTGAIYWYTRNSFLYKLINQTLRTEKNINNIFKLRLFITDLTSQLRTVQSDQRGMGDHSFLVYRGQEMLIKEIQQFKSAIGNSIRCNQFLSTSLDRQVALIFADSARYTPDIESVLMTIELDSSGINNNTVPFAYISHISSILDEQEVLLSMNSTLLIQSVILGKDNIWNIHLKHIDNQWDVEFDERSIFSRHGEQIFIRHLSKENKQFIAFQLLLDLILRLEQTSYAKQELLEFARSKYQNNPAQLKEIDDFETNYRSEDAVKWFSKDSFLYRLLNKSLRIEAIDGIVKMRYFINDLHNQLAELQLSFIKSLNGEKETILYRGLLMKVTQLNELRENFDGLISMNSFVSATQDENVAIVYSGNGDQSIPPDEVSVIYEMLIDTDIRSTPYAKIESIMADEEEILFSMGSTFRIGEIDEIRSRVYRVKLTMVHKEDELWNKLTEHLDS